MQIHLVSTLWLAGLLHYAVLIASGLVPGVLDWRNELARLSTLTRQLVWVHGAFIVLVIIGFGTLTILNAKALGSGTALARSMCGFIAVFWAARLCLQFLLFEPGRFITSRVLRLGHHGLTVLFTFFTVAFGWAAVAPDHSLITLWRFAP